MSRMDFGVPLPRRLYYTPHDFINLAQINAFINAQYVDTPILETAVPNLNVLDDIDYNGDDVPSLLEWHTGGVFRNDDKPVMFTMGASLTEYEEVNVKITTASLVDVFYKGSSIHIPSIFDNITIYENLRDYLTEISSVYTMLSQDQRKHVDRFADFMIIIAKEGVVRNLNRADNKEQTRVLEFCPKLQNLINLQANIGMLQFSLAPANISNSPAKKWAPLFTLPKVFIEARRAVDNNNRPKENNGLIGSMWG